MGRAKRAKPNKTPSKRSLKSLKTNNLNRNPACQKPNASAPLPTPTIPFEPTDHILLVGEGDFSFSQSLLFTHGCTSLLATSFDSSSAIEEKYPQAALNIAALRDEEGCKVLCDVDGTKLGKPGPGGGGRDVRKGGFDRVIFNFPHVGGLTKDVNRQVRHNQGEETAASLEPDTTNLTGLIEHRTPGGVFQGRNVTVSSFRFHHRYDFRGGTI